MTATDMDLSGRDLAAEQFSDFTFLNPDDALTPDEVDRHLKLLNNELARAQVGARNARNREVRALREFSLAKTPLLLDPQCPEPGVRGATKSQRDEWLSEQLPDLWWAYQSARTVRISAEEYMERLNRQVRCIQSIGKNARQSYGLPNGFGS